LDFNKIVEEKIQQAMAAGEFENLSGFGKPLNIHDSPFVKDDWKLTFNVLQKNGIPLPWMEDRKEIEELLQEAIRDCKHNLRFNKSQARIEFFKQLQTINQKIIDYNLIVPVVALQRKVLDSRQIFINLTIQDKE
jgi:DnaJ family protein C protein 28